MILFHKTIICMIIGIIGRNSITSVSYINVALMWKRVTMCEQTSSRISQLFMQESVSLTWCFIGLAANSLHLRLNYHFDFKLSSYISDLLALLILLIMISHWDSSCTQRKLQALKQSGKGTRRSLLYSTLTWSDSSQKSSLKILWKQNHKSEEAHTFHNFKRALRKKTLRIKRLSRYLSLIQQAKFLRKE